MDGLLTGWWAGTKHLNVTRPECVQWWWVYIVNLLRRIDSIQEMGYLHPDGELPPKSDWLDNDRLKEWQKSCDELRKHKEPEGW